MAPRRFSLEEAEALLPHLAPVLWQMRELKHKHDLLERKLAELGVKMKSNGRLLDRELKETREGMEAAANEIKVLVSRVGEMGCELKDIDMGLIDFRSERDGREVYLCWKLGEERIAWWHELHSGYASRQPL